MSVVRPFACFLLLTLLVPSELSVSHGTVGKLHSRYLTAGHDEERLQVRAQMSSVLQSSVERCGRNEDGTGTVMW